MEHIDHLSQLLLFNVVAYDLIVDFEYTKGFHSDPIGLRINFVITALYLTKERKRFTKIFIRNMKFEQ